MDGSRYVEMMGEAGGGESSVGESAANSGSSGVTAGR